MESMIMTVVHWQRRDSSMPHEVTGTGGRVGNKVTDNKLQLITWIDGPDDPIGAVKLAMRFMFW